MALTLSILGAAYFGSVIGYAMASDGRDGYAAFIWPVVVFIQRRR